MSREKILSITKDDFEVQAIRAGGPGGQKQNKTSSAIRMIHKASGAFAVSRDERSQKANMRSAFKKIIDDKKFQAWLKIEISKASGKFDKIQEEVDGQMREENIKVEVVNEDGRWEILE